MHSSGQFIASFLPLQGVKDQHSLGSAITYARRFSLSSILGVCPESEDDDGEQAMDRDLEEKLAPKKRAPKKKAATTSAMNKCKQIIESCKGADEYLRGKGIDPGDPPPNIRDKIIGLGAKGLKDKIEEQRKLEAEQEAAKIIDEADKVEPIKEDAA